MTIVCPGYINTGLFNGFTQTKIANLINPPSDEIYVAQRIINVSLIYNLNFIINFIIINLLNFYL